MSGVVASGVCISTRGYRRRFIYELCNRRPDGVHSGEIIFDEDGLPDKDLHRAERELYLREEGVYGVRWLYERTRAQAKQVPTADVTRLRTAEFARRERLRLDAMPSHQLPAQFIGHDDGDPLPSVGEGVLYVDFVALKDVAAGRGGDGRSPYRYWEEMLKHGVPVTIVSTEPLRVRLPSGDERPVCWPTGSGAPRPMSVEEAVQCASITRLCSRRQVACVVCARRDWADRGCFDVRRLWDLRGRSTDGDGGEAAAEPRDTGGQPVDPVRPGCRADRMKYVFGVYWFCESSDKRVWGGGGKSVLVISDL